MRRWEFKTMEVPSVETLDKALERLNEQGKDGWQPWMTVSAAVDGSLVRIWFKREIE